LDENGLRGKEEEVKALTKERPISTALKLLSMHIGSSYADSML
jgi:hypothetical protein